MISIRTRILVPVIGLVIVGCVLIALLAVRDSHREIEDIYDAQLAQGARLLQGVLAQREPGQAERPQLYQAFDRAMGRVGEAGVAHPYEARLTFLVWATSGELLARSAGAPTLARPPTQAGLHAFTQANQDWRGFLLNDREQGLLIWVGERDDIRQNLIQHIVSHTLWPTLVGVPLLALVIWLTIGWGLRPLQRMAVHIRSRSADSFDLLALTAMPTELAPMQTALNRQLTLLKDLLEHERRFVSDAAHELRTPLAVLHIHAQNAERADTPALRAEALGFLQQGVLRATRVASQLLTMAQLEPEAADNDVHQTVDLEALVREELAELTPLALAKQVELTLHSDGACLVTGDAASLVIAVQNLLTNALNFSPPHSEVGVVIGVDNGAVILRVLDSGPGIEPSDLPRLFDRFYSRGNANGAGLGLAIVETVMRRMGGEVSVVNRSEGGVCAQLRF